MLLSSPKARWWRALGLALAALSGLLFWLQGRFEPFRHGGSAWGLGWGIAAALLVLLLLGFGVRKRAYRSSLGTLEGWLQAHVVLGLLVLMLALFHTGFRFDDRLALTALVLLVLVVLSGLAGIFLYSLFPRRLTEVGSNRTPAQISEQLNQIAAAMGALAVGRSSAFQRLAATALTAARPGKLAGWRLLVARPRREAGEGAAFKRQVAEVPPAEREPLRQLLVLSRQQKELTESLLLETYYRNWLDAWLYIHLPLSLGLLVILLAHIVAAIYYRGF